MFKLVIQDDEGKTTVVPLIRDEITIGRKEGNTIRLTERNVSRRHARILRNNGEVQIEDLGSYNGIRVNNARIAERVSLRVSDQVQIGDYKLYLKAEGVEQVDDARTMPIERIDSVKPTEVIPALAPGPTQPMATPAQPAQAPAAQLAATPNRSQVAVADTDPQGRPVASAAAVAALTAPTAYGKLVALSSNFAGKEFELTRPQMIIGRTPENDIVVNHRSISRNHAKLVREPETGRYTISDLQSSNGVRVNGQDYGKVELRRGDVIDLGHVRLRFVEPGEDFVFARDAVITDVPETGGGRKLFVGLAVAALLVGAVVVVMAMRDTSTPSAGDDPNPNVAAGGDAGNLLASAIPDANEAVVEAPDAAQVAASDAAGEIRMRCREQVTKKNWQELTNCSAQLKSHDAALAQTFKEQAIAETKAEAALRHMSEALRDGNLKKASTELDRIPTDSVYRKEAADRYQTDEDKAIRALVTAARARAGNCRTFNKLMDQAKDTEPARVVSEAKKQVQCKEAVATVPRDPQRDPPKDPPKSCNAEDLTKAAMDQYTGGRFGEALTGFEKAYACRSDAMTLVRLVMSACRTGNRTKAKSYFKKLTPQQQNQVISICVGNGISQEFLQN